MRGGGGGIVFIVGDNDFMVGYFCRRMARGLYYSFFGGGGMFFWGGGGIGHSWVVNCTKLGGQFFRTYDTIPWNTKQRLKHQMALGLAYALVTLKFWLAVQNG